MNPKQMSGFHKITFLACLALMAGCRQTTLERLPNIIMIQADDLGWDDLGVHGNQLINTPNLDSLAGESVRFNQFYVTPVCATTRASLLTGRHFLRTGVSHVHGGKDFLHLDETTIANVLKGAGYVTGMWGKWHAGKTAGYFPWERGFDEAFMARLYDHYDNEGSRNGKRIKTIGWTTEVLTNMAIDFMKANREVPFFAYLSYLSCHAPLDAPAHYVDKYMDRGLSENLATLYGMVEQMDHHIGRLLDSVDVLGLTAHSVVFFLSDNGPAILNAQLTDEDRAIRNVNGLKGHKGNIWENGIKSPLFVSYPGHFTPASVDRLADVSDLFPTMAELAGYRLNMDSLHIDGRSILPYLKDSAANLPSKEIFLYANPGWPPTDQPWTPQGVKDEYRPWKFSDGGELAFKNQIIGLRSEPYKLLYNPGPILQGAEPNAEGYVLIDIQEDPCENENLAAASGQLLEEMQRHLRYWHASVFKDAHSFEMPVFQIAGDPSATSDVLAYAPHQVGPNVRNAANHITGFALQDDYARYRVNVLREGAYDIRIAYDLEGSRPVQMAFDLGGEVRNITFSPGEKSVEIKNISMTRGGHDWKMNHLAGNNRLKLYRFICSYSGP
jgi:arylsulfatase A-like enzyme